MQDTKNLKKKIGEYSTKIKRLQDEGGEANEIAYWQGRLREVQRRIQAREENQRKNKKQFKKAN